jgi:hypothetical protein
MGLNYFFNASGTPDLAPIENIWRVEKQRIETMDHWDDASLVVAIKREWQTIKQDRAMVNRYIDSMVDRVKSLHQRNGDMTEF